MKQQPYIVFEDGTWKMLPKEGKWLTRKQVRSLLDQWHDQQLEDGAGVFNLDLNGLLDELFGCNWENCTCDNHK